MINLETFVLGLLATSVLTGLATEGAKIALKDHNISYKANTLAGIVAIVLAAAIGFGYVILTNIAITAQIIVCIIALIFMSWLCAMVGYDKVIQTISQFKTVSKESDSK